MSFLLDTNIVSAYLRRPALLAHRFEQHTGRLYLPTIVLAELHVVPWRLRDPGRMLDAIEALIRDEVTVLDFDASCAAVFGQVRAERLNQGVTIPLMDLLIGSVALAYDLTVVSHNTDHFALIPGLRLVNWLAP
jgi:predicted nucleic acid-binding protein